MHNLILLVLGMLLLPGGIDSGERHPPHMRCSAGGAVPASPAGPRGGPPPNDTCANAQSIACNSIQTFDNSSATDEPSDPPFSCGFFGPANGAGSVWFRFVAADTSALLGTSRSAGSDDTLLAVYSGTCGALAEIGCNEDDGVGLLSRVCLTGLTPGNAYLVQVASFSSFSLGQITLELICPLPDPVCSLGGANCQNLSGSAGITSDRSASIAAEDFTPASGGNINEVCWWGLDFGPAAQDTFEIRYYDSLGGLPNSIIGGPFSQSGGSLTVQGPADTCMNIQGDPALQYRATHAPVAATGGECFWIEISNANDGSASWLWAAATSGNGQSIQDGDFLAGPDGYDPSDLVGGTDLAFCLNIELGDATPCAAPFGRCCVDLANGCFDCIADTTQDQCENQLGGLWTQGQPCGPAACGPVCGACCDPDGGCILESESNCTSPRQYQGDFSVCNPNPCSPLLGACCLPDNTCAALSTTDCSNQDGSSQGPGTRCDQVVCNETCDTALLIDCNTTFTADNTFAASDPSDPVFSCQFGGAGPGTGSLWYKFVASNTGAYVSTLDSSPPADDSTMAVYEAGNPGDPCGTLVELSCSEDVSGSNFLSELCVEGLTIGTTYYLQLASFSDDTRGAYIVRLQCPCPCDPNDSDSDGVGDACDLCPGADDNADCNMDAAPDCLEIAGGSSEDCNGNTLPDECEPGQWLGPSGGSFSTPSYWIPAGIPGSHINLVNFGPADNRCVLDADGETVVCSMNIAGAGGGRQILRIGAGSRLMSSEAVNLGLRGSIELQGGEVAGGAVTNTDNTVSGFGTIWTSVVNSGTIASVAGTNDNLVLAGSSLENQAGGTLRASVGTLLVVSSSSVVQDGALEAQSLAGIVFAESLTNTGFVELLGGTLSASDPGGITNTSSGTIFGFGTIYADLDNQGHLVTIADTQVVGDLVNNGTIIIQSGLLTVTGTLSGAGTIIGGFGGRDANSSGLTIHGDLDLSATDPSLVDLSACTVQFDGGYGGVQRCEVMSQDLGPIADRDLENYAFAIDTLRIGPAATTVQLLDRYDNKGAGSRVRRTREAMYVRHLILDPGVTLELCGLHLYYETVSPSNPLAPGSGVMVIDSVGGGELARVDARRNR